MLGAAHRYVGSYPIYVGSWSDLCWELPELAGELATNWPELAKQKKAAIMAAFHPWNSPTFQLAISKKIPRLLAD